MNESEYMKEARLTDEQIKVIAEAQGSWGASYGYTKESDFEKPRIPAHAYTFARAIEDALLSHIAKGEQARAVGGEFCCEAAWRDAKMLAWKQRDINCGCDHSESCAKCYPPDFRPGGKFSEYRATPTTAGQQAGGARPAPHPWHGLTKDEIDHAVGELVEYGTEFVAPLYSVVEGVERKLRERNAVAADRGQQAGGGEDGKHCQVQVIHLTDQQREMLSAKGVTHIPGRADSAAGTGLSAAIDRTRAAGRCDLCKGTGIADLPDPWGGVTGTCPDCNGTGGVPGTAATDYPECSGDPASCPENEGHGCCNRTNGVSAVVPSKAHIEYLGRVVRSLRAHGRYTDPDPGGSTAAALGELEAWLDASGVLVGDGQTKPPADADAAIPAEVGRRALEALTIAEAALADIGDADREPGDDLAWCEARAARDLPLARAAITELQQALEKHHG